MTSPPLAAVLTLGCKLNLADSQEIANGLRLAGFRVVDRLCDADAYVVNTCSVTHVADRKARRLIRAVQRMSPDAAVAVTGCYPQSAGEASIRELGAGFVAGTRDADKAGLVEFLREQVRPERACSTAAEPSPGRLHTRAFVKAQEGCNDVCAFCIVPRTRGREESRTPGQVIAGIERAMAGGAREVVITGTQLGAWGRDFPVPLKPHHLIAAVLDGTDVPRIRFSSLQPQDISPELLALWQDPRLMPHFHLALQSGSQGVLEAMRRRYTAGAFADAAARIRAAVPDVAITTDVIAGFPGESEADFAATLELCREVGFARIHAFPYSSRARTAAARLEGQVPEPVKRERMQRLLALGDDLAGAYRARFHGSERPVLWEHCDGAQREHCNGAQRENCDGAQRENCDGAQRETGGRWSGLTDNYIRVYASGNDLFNRITPARLGAPTGDGVEGDITGGTP